MTNEPEIILNREYSVARISGTWSFRQKIKKIGIEPYKAIIFLKKTKSAYHLKISGEKKIKRIPENYLCYIEMVDPAEPNVKDIIKQKTSNIRVGVFRTDITDPANIFGGKEEYVYSDYNFKINYLPGVSTIYGENYENKKLRNSILTDFPDIFLGIIDYQNLESDLYLVTQFMDMDAKIVLALRNYDPDHEKNGKIDFNILSKLLGIPIINYEEYYNEEGEIIIEEEIVLNTIIKTNFGPEKFIRSVNIDYGREIETRISKIINCIKKLPEDNMNISSRYFAINLLEQDNLIIKSYKVSPNCEKLKKASRKEINSLEKRYKEHVFSILKQARKSYSHGAIVKVSDKKTNYIASKVDKILINSFWGFPIFLLFIGLTFYVTFELGKYPQQWITGGIKWLSGYLQLNMENGFWKDLMIDGVINGAGAVLVFLPNIFIFFLLIGIMENSGYLSRLAFILDKFLIKTGLNGKSFIPIIMGFGCSIPAIMSVKKNGSYRQKILTMMIIPFMSCSARLPIYILIVSAFFPEYPVLILFLIYIIGILVAIIVSLFLSKTILKQKEDNYIMELTPYRRPTLRISMSYMWNRGKEYLEKISGIILIASIAIWLLSYFPKDINYSKDYDNILSQAKTEKEIKLIQTEKNNEKLEKSYIGEIGRFVEPVMKPLGFDWKMSTGIIAGIAGKEITISTMGILYQTDADDGKKSGLQEKLKEATYNTGEKVFDKVVALSFMVFILLYLPCIAVSSTIWRETSSFKWALISAVYSIVVAWIISFGIYQIGNLIV